MGCCGDRPPPSDNRVGPGQDEVREVEVDDNFDGPLKKRSCTDIPCLLILVVFLGGMGYVTYLGVSSGDPYVLIYGRDTWGNTCNRQNSAINGVSLSGRNTIGLTRSFYFQFVSLLTSNVLESAIVCVSQCPGRTLSTVSDLQDYANETNVQLCRYDVSSANYQNGSGVCPPLPILAHDNVLNRCVPRAAVGAAQSALGVATNALSLLQAECDGEGDFWQRAASDLQRTWKELAYLAAIAVGVALVITLLMGFLAKIIIWTIVILIAAGAIGGTAFCWYTYHTYKTQLDAIPEANRQSSEVATVKNWLIIASVVTVVSVILLLVLLIMRRRIALVAQLFREAGKALLRMPLLLVQPLWTLVALASFLTALGYGFMYIETAGDPQVTSSSGFVKFKQSDVLFYMKWYYLFGVLWVVQLVFACHQMVLAGAVAQWYFSRDKKLGWPILASMGRLMRYHLGSVAFGAFLIAVIQFARIVLAYIQKKLAGRAGPLADFLFRCLQCCLWCFEKFMKFINKNAYIMVAIYGYSFCKGARRAFTLLLSNILRVGAINSVGTFVLFLAKLGIVAVVVVIALQFFKSMLLCYLWVPLVVSGLIALLISHTFLSVYGMAIDTIFLCFCEDCERNDGVSKPYYMSKDLMDYVENSKDALEALKKRERIPTNGIRRVAPAPTEENG